MLSISGSVARRRRRFAGHLAIRAPNPPFSPAIDFSHISNRWSNSMRYSNQQEEGRSLYSIISLLRVPWRVKRVYHPSWKSFLIRRSTSAEQLIYLLRLLEFQLLGNYLKRWFSSDITRNRRISRYGIKFQSKRVQRQKLGDNNEHM